MKRCVAKLSRPLRSLLLLVLLLPLGRAVWQGMSWVKENHDTPTICVIPLGLETPGTKIEEIDLEPNVAPNSPAIRVSTPRTRFLLHSLAQLQGVVAVHTPQQALHFVRLRTARDYCYDWPGADAIQEIVSFSQAMSPAFADTGHADGFSRSGVFGLLSDQAYKAGKFLPAQVKLVPEGFQIVRWVCRYASLEGTALEQWQETVGSDGKYTCTVLHSRKTPVLPDTSAWYIMGRA